MGSPAIMTPEHAAALCDAHDVHQLLENDEEVEMLREQNPELLAAYKALARLATGGKAGER